MDQIAHRRQISNTPGNIRPFASDLGVTGEQHRLSFQFIQHAIRRARIIPGDMRPDFNKVLFGPQRANNTQSSAYL
jgi:hypothetical protein